MPPRLVWRVYLWGTPSAIPVPSPLMAAPAEVIRSPRTPWLLPAALAVMVVVALAAVLFLANRAAEPDVPAVAGPFVPPPALPYNGYDVERNQGGVLRLSGGGGAPAIDAQLPADARVWFLEPATLADLEPPMVVNVIAVPNEVRNFAIRMLAFGPAGDGGSINDEEFIPLADGFAGHETSADVAERTMLSGVARSIDGNIVNVLLNGGTPSTIEIDDGAPVRVLRQGTAAEIQPGFRVALHLDASGAPDATRGILVLTTE